jgi:hypothetical protein
MTNGGVLLQAVLNGDSDHPAAPGTPDEPGVILSTASISGVLVGKACTKVQAENHPLARCIQCHHTPP